MKDKEDSQIKISLYYVAKILKFKSLRMPHTPFSGTRLIALLKQNLLLAYPKLGAETRIVLVELFRQ
jgi:hypothetical protein